MNILCNSEAERIYKTGGKKNIYNKEGKYIYVCIVYIYIYSHYSDGWLSRKASSLVLTHSIYYQVQCVEKMLLGGPIGAIQLLSILVPAVSGLTAAGQHCKIFASSNSLIDVSGASTPRNMVFSLCAPKIGLYEYSNQKSEEGDLSSKLADHSQCIFTLIQNDYFSIFQCVLSQM